MTRVLLAGDIFIDRPSADGVLDCLTGVRAESDLFFANLETPMTHATEGSRWRTPPDHDYWIPDGEGLHWMKAHPDAVGALSAAGVTGVTLANNHMMDFGVDGLRETLEILDRAGIGHTGAGRTIGDATTPFVAIHDGVRVALLSYTVIYYAGEAASENEAGMAVVKVHTAYEPPRRLFVQPAAPAVIRTWVDDHVLAGLVEDVTSAKAIADVVVVGFHWGVSNSRKVEAYQSQLARACIDAGATMIKGVHPHYHGPMEIYKGCPIFYSLGHLVFDTLEVVRKTPATSYIHANDAIVARCVVDGGKVTRIDLIPLSPDETNTPSLRSGIGGLAIAQQAMDFPGTRELRAMWDGSQLTVPLASEHDAIKPQADAGHSPIHDRSSPMSLEIDDHISQAVNGAYGAGRPIVLGYVGADGSPNLSVRGSIHVHGTQQLAMWGRNPNGGFQRAIASNPNVALMVFEPERPAPLLIINGRAALDPSQDDKVWEQIPASEREKDPERMGGAVIIEVDAIKGRGSDGEPFSVTRQ